MENELGGLRFTACVSIIRAGATLAAQAANFKTDGAKCQMSQC